MRKLLCVCGSSIESTSEYIDSYLIKFQDEHDAAHAERIYELKTEEIVTIPKVGYVGDITENLVSSEDKQKNCDHMYLTHGDRALGKCGLCGISFGEWHG